MQTGLIIKVLTERRFRASMRKNERWRERRKKIDQEEEKNKEVKGSCGDKEPVGE